MQRGLHEEAPTEKVMQDIKLWTMDEVAGVLRVDRSTISRLMGAGVLPYVELGSQKTCRKLVRAQDLHRFVESRIRNLADKSFPEDV